MARKPSSLKRKLFQQLLHLYKEDAFELNQGKASAPDVAELVEILRAAGYKLRHVDIAEADAAGATGRCRVTVKCPKSGLSVNLEAAGDAQCRCPATLQDDNASTWCVTSLVSSREGLDGAEVGSSVLPPVAPALSEVVGAALRCVLRLLRGEPVLRRAASTSALGAQPLLSPSPSQLRLSEIDEYSPEIPPGRSVSVSELKTSPKKSGLAVASRSLCLSPKGTPFLSENGRTENSILSPSFSSCFGSNCDTASVSDRIDLCSDKSVTGETAVLLQKLPSMDPVPCKEDVPKTIGGIIVSDTLDIVKKMQGTVQQMKMFMKTVRIYMEDKEQTGSCLTSTPLERMDEVRVPDTQTKSRQIPVSVSKAKTTLGPTRLSSRSNDSTHALPSNQSVNRTLVEKIPSRTHVLSKKENEKKGPVFSSSSQNGPAVSRRFSLNGSAVSRRFSLNGPPIHDRSSQDGAAASGRTSDKKTELSLLMREKGQKDSTQSAGSVQPTSGVSKTGAVASSGKDPAACSRGALQKGSALPSRLPRNEPPPVPGRGPRIVGSRRLSLETATCGSKRSGLPAPNRRLGSLEVVAEVRSASQHGGDEIRKNCAETTGRRRPGVSAVDRVKTRVADPRPGLRYSH